MKEIKTGDYFYVDSDPFAPPKQAFVQVADAIEKCIPDQENPVSIVDFGCAAGAFPGYLSKRFPGALVTGCDHVHELVCLCRKRFPGLDFREASILDRNSLPDEYADILTVLGVISIFDDIEPIIDNLSRWLKPGGRLYLHDMFNPYDVDVFVKYRRSSGQVHDKGELVSGWNITSQLTLERLLKSRGCKQVSFEKFSISVDLIGDPGDPLRSWTEFLVDGSRQIVNATCLKQPQFMVEALF